MSMRYVAFIVGILALTTHDARGQNECVTRLPQTLRMKLSAEHPDFSVVTLNRLNPDYRRFYQKEAPKGCPGVADLDFFGTGKRDYAIVLAPDKQGPPSARLVLAEPLGSGSWKITLLATVETGPAPVIFVESPGKYEDAYGNKTILAKHPVLLFVGYESWATVYAWTGGKIDELWLSD